MDGSSSQVPTGQPGLMQGHMVGGVDHDQSQELWMTSSCESTLLGFSVQCWCVLLLIGLKNMSLTLFSLNLMGVTYFIIGL